MSRAGGLKRFVPGNAKKREKDMAGIKGMMGQTALVVKEVNMEPEGDRRIRIVARNAGLMSSLMSLLGVDATTTLEIFTTRVLFTEGSLAGQRKTCIPLSSMSAAIGGFSKPLAALIAGIVFVIAGIVLTCFLHVGYYLLASLLGIALAAVYVFSRAPHIAVVSNGGVSVSMCLKSSVLFNREIAEKVVDILNQLVLDLAKK